MLDFEKDIREILVLAAGVGMIGGFVFQLLQNRRGGTGFIELPGKGTGRLWDLGFIGSMLIGGVAAVAFLLVYQPVEVVTKGVTSKEYPVLELIAMSLVAGAAGSSIMGALTTSAAKVAGAAKLEDILSGLEQLKSSAEDSQVETTPESVAAQTNLLIQQVQDALR